MAQWPEASLSIGHHFGNFNVPNLTPLPNEGKGTYNATCNKKKKKKMNTRNLFQLYFEPTNLPFTVKHFTPRSPSLTLAQENKLTEPINYMNITATILINLHLLILWYNMYLLQNKVYY